MSALDALLPIAAVAILYGIGLRRMWERVGVGRLVPVWRAVTFGIGIAVTALTLGPPLDHLADTDLTAHMVQHVLLIWVCAPLLVVGTPFPPILWAFDDDVRRRGQRAWRRVHRSAAGPAWPAWVVVAMVLQGVTLLAWHVPSLYDAAVRNDLVHAMEHATFLGTAVFFWWALAGAVRRARFGPGILAVFVAKLPGLLIGVGLAIDRHIWYPVYGRGSAALENQHVAGVVMWVGGGMIATVTALILFGNWLAGLERAAPSRAVGMQAPVPEQAR